MLTSNGGCAPDTWVRRILDHDGFELGGIKEEGGIEAWLRLADAVGLTRAEVEWVAHYNGVLTAR